MMVKRLQEVLGTVSGISAWKVVDRQIEGQELFFVGRDPDMRRSKSVRHTELTVYRDFEATGSEGRAANGSAVLKSAGGSDPEFARGSGPARFRGSVTVSIHPTQGSGEIRELVEQSLASARYVRNEFYPLVAPGGSAIQVPQSAFNGRPLEEWLAPLTGALFAEEGTDQAAGEQSGSSGLEGLGRLGGRAAKAARINSAELFLDRVDTRVVSSAGVDVSYRSFRGYIELIVEAEGPAGEVEMHRELRFSDFDPDWLWGEVRRQKALCRDRAGAMPTPQLKDAVVLITGDPLELFFEYHLTHSAAESVYSGISTLKVGEAVQGEAVRGDSLTMTLKPYLANSDCSAPYDEDGFCLRPAVVIEGGILKRYWGPLRFCHYLGIPATGSLRNVSVAPGKKTAQALSEGPHLEVVYFSDFLADPLTGDFGGEIRLAYYSDGKGGERIPVTGGSVSGNMREVQGELELSSELQSRSGFQGPQTVRLPAIAVTGAA